MKQFRIGQTAVVKDFYAIEPPAQSLDLKVLRVTDHRVYFRDGDGKEFQLKLRRSAKWEWCFYEPAILITPIATQ